MNAIKKIDKAIQHVGEALSALCMLAMTIIVTVAVVCRHLNIQFTASDELARYTMIWCTFIGIIICTRQKGHVAVTILPDALKGKAQKALQILIEIIVILTLVWLTKLSVDLVKHALGNGQKAPITKIPYWFMYSSMVIGFGGSVIREVQILIRDFILKKPEAPGAISEEGTVEE